MLKRENKWMDIVAALLIFAAFWVTALRLDATEWSKDLARIKTFVLFGFLLGYLLGQSHFRRWIILSMAGVYSAITIPWVLGLTMDPEVGWNERMVSLLGRLSASFDLFVTNQPVKDYILFLLSMALLFWFMSLIGGFQLSRSGNPWIPVVVAGIALVSIDISSPEVAHRARFSGAFMLFSLLGLGRLFFLGERNRWNSSGIAVDSETGYDLGRSMLISGLILVLIAWNVPAISELLDTGAQARIRFSRLRERLTNLTAGLDVPTYSVADFSYGNDLKLGTGVPLDDAELFRVQTSRTHPTGIPFYWKSQSYDRFEDGEWKNTVTKEHLISPNEWPVRPLPEEDRVEIEFTYSIRAASLQTLYLPEQPQFVSRPAIWVGDAAVADEVDIIAVKSENSLLSGESIKVEARLKDLTVSILREAGTVYPDWVLQRYLHLPDDFPQEAADLASNLTSDAETAYDKARIITAYLRNEITYEDTVPALPEGENVISWFLFTHKAGFCNYYATTEVLMLRSLGIPARMVVGFAQGEADPDRENTYQVRMNHYHAWPEVYFPNIGWVQFEPTASQPVHSLRLGLESTAAERAESDVQTDLEAGDLPGRDRLDDLEEDPTFNAEEQIAPETTRVSPLWFVGGGLLLLGLVFYIWWRRPFGTFQFSFALPEVIGNQLQRRGYEIPEWVQRWKHRSQLSPLERLESRIPWMLVLFGEKANPGDTTAEMLFLLDQHLDQQAQDISQQFLLFCQRGRFSLYPVDQIHARDLYLKLCWQVLLTAINRWRGV